jgi:uncharacterized membrane protein
MRSTAVLALCTAGIAANGWLLHLKATQGLAGCGATCQSVLASRWSAVGGLPVSWFGIALYLLVALSLWRRRATWLAGCLLLLAASVLWFTALQALVLRSICPWCMTAHGIALATVVAGGLSLRGSSPRWPRAATVALVAIKGLALAQIAGPTARTHRIDALAAAADTDVHARGSGRKVAFEGAAKTYDVASLPRLGPVDAKHVLVEYFDYQCPACRTMHGFVEALRRKHPRDIAVIVLPVPLERSCNPLVGPKDHQYPGSCHLAKAALAVWRSDPASFEDVHRALFIDPPAGLRLAGGAPVVDDPWIDEVLRANAGDWIVFGTSSKQLPKLLISGRRILHGLPSGADEFVRTMETELGLDP